MQKIQDSKEVDFFINLGLKIRQLRNSHGYNSHDFAKLARIRVAYLSSIERGKKNISLIFLLRIAKALDISPGNLVADL